MSRFEWLPELRAHCEREHVLVERESRRALRPARLWTIDYEDWGRFAAAARSQGCRWSAVWAEQVDTALFDVNSCFVFDGDYLVVRASLPIRRLVLPSQTPWFPAANRPERHLQDMFGIVFSDHPDGRRWTRHKGWPEGHYPLRKDFPSKAAATPETGPGIEPGIEPDIDYPFPQVPGAGVSEIAVGPVHASALESGHFRFQAVGETILALEARLGYVHKGIEKLAEDRDAVGLARLAGRVSGDTTVGHTWAACMAMERAAGLNVPHRALWLRALLAERERIANHLGDIGAVCNDVGFAFAEYQFSRLRETWQRVNQTLFGHRLLMDTVIPGGVARDLDANGVATLRTGQETLRRELAALLPIIDHHPSLENRLLGVGVLPPDEAARLGVVGYVGKASGVDSDVRRDHRYAPYHRLQVASPLLQAGDIDSRLRVRAEEVGHSLDLLAELLNRLPEGAIAVPWQPPVSGAEGLASVEGWRGEILCYVRFAANGRVARFFPRDPSWLNWPALERLVHGSIVPDFPVCNKSINGSYSGQDL